MADGGRLVFAFWIFKSRQVTAQRTLRIIFSLPRFEDPEREHKPATIWHEPWPHGVLAVDCLPSRSGVPPMRRALQRRSPGCGVSPAGTSSFAWRSRSPPISRVYETL